MTAASQKRNKKKRASLAAAQSLVNSAVDENGLKGEEYTVPLDSEGKRLDSKHHKHHVVLHDAEYDKNGYIIPKAYYTKKHSVAMKVKMLKEKLADDKAVHTEKEQRLSRVSLEQAYAAAMTYISEINSFSEEIVNEDEEDKKAKTEEKQKVEAAAITYQETSAYLEDRTKQVVDNLRESAVESPIESIIEASKVETISKSENAAVHEERTGSNGPAASESSQRRRTWVAGAADGGGGVVPTSSDDEAGSAFEMVEDNIYFKPDKAGKDIYTTGKTGNNDSTGNTDCTDQAASTSFKSAVYTAVHSTVRKDAHSGSKDESVALVLSDPEPSDSVETVTVSNPATPTKTSTETETCTQTRKSEVKLASGEEMSLPPLSVHTRALSEAEKEKKIEDYRTLTELVESLSSHEGMWYGDAHVHLMFRSQGL